MTKDIQEQAKQRFQVLMDGAPIDKRQFYFQCLAFETWFRDYVRMPAQAEYNLSWLPKKGVQE